MMRALNFRLKLAIVINSFIAIAFAGNQQEERLAPDVQASMAGSLINPFEPYLVFDDEKKGPVWLNDMSNRLKKYVPDEFMRKQLLIRVNYEAARAGLDSQLVLSVMMVESGFSKYAISSAGALGIMQVMPFWQKLIGHDKQSLLDLDTNIRYGCTILRHYLQIEKGNVNRALARYNGSLRSLDNLDNNDYVNKVIQAYNTYWQVVPVILGGN